MNYRLTSDTITIRPYVDDAFTVVRVERGFAGSLPSLPARNDILSASELGSLERRGVRIIEADRHASRKETAP